MGTKRETNDDVMELAERIKNLDFYGIDAEVKEIAEDIEKTPLMIIEWLIEQLEV